MAENETENFNELCRLCAIKINTLTGVNIFDNTGIIRDISKKITTCLPVQVHEGDRLPKMICNGCAYRLESCFQFRERSIRTENLFIELIRKENNTPVIEKVQDNKDMKQTSINLTTTIDNQQLQIVQNSQELLDHTNMSLSHELASRESLMVTQQIILNSHELDNIEINPHELNSHGMTHENLHSEQLALHHESTMAQLVQPDMQISDSHLTVQNLELIHSQHNLIADHYEPIHEKNISNNDTCLDNTIITVEKQRDNSSCKDEQNVELKNQFEIIKTSYSDTSDSEDSSDPDFDPLDCGSTKNEDKEDLIHNTQLYDDQNNFLLNTAEVGTSESTESNQYYSNVGGKNMNNKNGYYDEELNKCILCQEEFLSVEELNLHRNQMHPNKMSTSESIHSPHKTETNDQDDDNFFKEESSDDENRLRATSEFMNDDEDGANVDSNKNSKRKPWEPKICKECGKSYKTNYKLAEHMRKHTGEQPYKCTMCDKAFRSKIGLAQHAAKHTGQYDFECSTCGKGFQCRSYLIVHQRVHSTVKPFPCEECGKNFKTKQSLLDHMNRHLGLKPFMCEICGRGFITKGLCKSHQKVHSGKDNRQYPCTVCNKLFVSKSYLATHVRIHTGEKPFMCEVCGKGFLTRVDLRIHSTMHTGEKSFVCEICGKAFARRDALRCHRRSHTGERPYRCDICGQTFTQFTPMAIHKRLHTGERPYSCELCKKTFVSRSTMMSHRKRHVP